MLTQTPIVPYIPAKYMARARKFYEEKVGLKPRQEYAGGVIYECGKGSWVFMYPTPGAGTSQASTAFWAVEDVAAEVAELKSKGVKFEVPTKSSSGASAIALTLASRAERL